MDAAVFEAAGLYEPTAPNAAERLELLEWLASQGATVEQMVGAAREKSLVALAADLALRPMPSLSVADLATRVGLPVEQIRAISLAAGLRPRSPNEPAFTDEDVQVFRAFVVGAALLGAAPTTRFARTVGAALAQIAEAAVALYLVAAEEPLLAAKASPLALAQQNLRAVQSLDAVHVVMHGLFRTHMATGSAASGRHGVSSRSTPCISASASSTWSASRPCRAG